MMARLKKIFNGEITWHLKRRLKRLFHYKWKAWYIFIIQLFYLRGAHNIAVQQYSEKERIESLYFSEGKRHFSYTIWLMISEKSIMVYTFLHHGPWWCVPCTKSLSKQCIQKKLFTRISNCLKTYIHIERRNFKTFWKENCTIGLNSCYLLNFENGTEHDMIVLMEFACIRQSVGS